MWERGERGNGCCICLTKTLLPTQTTSYNACWKGIFLFLFLFLFFSGIPFWHVIVDIKQDNICATTSCKFLTLNGKKSNNTSRELEQWNCTSVERKIYHSVTEWTSLLIAIGTTCFSNLLDIVLAHSFKNHDSQLTILQRHFKSISIVFSYHCRCNSCFVYILHLIFYDLNEQRYHNDCKRHSILPSFQSSLYLRKTLEN